MNCNIKDQKKVADKMFTHLRRRLIASCSAYSSRTAVIGTAEISFEIHFGGAASEAEVRLPPWRLGSAMLTVAVTNAGKVAMVLRLGTEQR